ncbi:MAG: 4-(cytidine 5'-diphospho)-2-C-methyl-D-erythritol kinase [Planctomycetaceae bacterium]|jgi:4-diphosphocytidyl-2-C-methyl-D-erythritol kinase|nr:4-(cytidine 5'-diphospho)-2-C-methyl-D-erythritol kinase [Planctomycetaceae bacterium]
MSFTPQKWKGSAPAKINLFFEVLEKRSDHFHDVFSVCGLISLQDTMVFLPKPSGSLHFSIENGFRRPMETNRTLRTEIPVDETNLVMRAVRLVRETYQVKSSADITLTKRIPVQAGLGGGSSDAATAIMLANKAWKLGLSTTEMMSLGAEIGSDVPLFFVPGMSLGEGRGERITPIRTEIPLDLVIVKPPEGIVTKEAFLRLDDVGIQVKKKNPDQLIHALKTANIRRIAAGLFNRLETAARTMCPKLEVIKSALAKRDCLGVMMTGSGTACFGICRNHRHACHVAAGLYSLQLGDVFVTQTLSFPLEQERRMMPATTS